MRHAARTTPISQESAGRLAAVSIANAAAIIASTGLTGDGSSSSTTISTATIVLVAGPKQRQRPVARDRRPALGIVEVVGVFRADLLLAGDQPGLDLRARHEMAAQAAEQVGLLGELLDQDVPRTLERGFGVRHLVAEVSGRRGLGVAAAIRQQACGKRLEPALARDLPLGAPLGLEGQVEILELGLGRGAGDLRRQLFGELALGLDRLADGLATGAELAQIAEALLQLAELTVVQAARGFLAVARDERHRRALVQERDRGPDLLGPGADILGDDAGDLVERCGHGSCYPACCGRG